MKEKVKMKSYKELLNTQDGGAVFVLGAGPSLYYFLKSPYSLILLSDPVISVNSSIMALPWFDGSPKDRYWISNDSLCRRWSWFDNVKKAKCTKIVRNSWKKYYDEIPDFYIFHPRETTEDIIDPEGDGLAYCSSVPTAIDLSIQMGYKKIFLLGVDHKDRNGKTHFWQYFPQNKWARQRLKPAQSPFSLQKQVFDLNKVAYSALKGFADSKGVKIYNCNTKSGTEVETFEIIAISEIEKCLK